MVLRCAFSALLLSILAVSVLSTDPYSSANYIRKTGHAVAVIDKTLYIDGGELTQFVNATSRESKQVNDTLSIPLDVSWTNQSVVITSITKAAPAFDSEALWTDESSKSMFMWGGQGPWGNLTKTRDLWKYDVAGGTWGKQAAANADVFLTVVRSTNAAWTTCNGAGFYVGGFGSVWTDSAFAVGNVGTPVPGMLTYNLTTGSWANESTAGLNNLHTLISGSAACLPSFGSAGQGVVMVLGGEVTPQTAYNESEPNLVGLGNVTFWDIGKKTWYSQQTTGDIPDPRSQFCAVSAAGPNGTHEVFVYGGNDVPNNTIFQDVYILSIPGFVWFKALVTTGGIRQHQKCVLAGNRQMIVVGGSPGSSSNPDPWTNGIGVLDVSSLSWQDSFNPDAEAYASPDVVTSWYDAGNQDKVSWTSDTVKSLFISQDGTSSGGTGTDGTSSGGTGTDGTGSGGSSSTSPGAATPVGAIVGGVVGGVALLAIAALVLFLIRRRRQDTTQGVAPPVDAKDSSMTYHTLTPYDPSMDKVGHDAPHELPYDRAPAMLAADSTPSELATGNWRTEGGEQGWRRQEPGRHAPYEMP